VNLANNAVNFERENETLVDSKDESFKLSPLAKAGIRIRRFPYPYQAMLAICSDLDETPDRQVYFEIMRFLNTTEQTVMGCGVGLEVGNTIYFDMPPTQFAYWNTDDTGRAMVRELIRSGHIDCLHSYGDLATTREHIKRALEELDRHNCHLKVWVDHGTAPTNFDGDIMKGIGDVPGSPAHHADLTLAYGVEYVWRGRVTSIIGQNVPRKFAGLGAVSHPFSSGKTILKEFSKGLLGRWGNQKYAMHAGNRILQKAKLRNGQEIYEFIRCNPHWGGVSSCETADGIKDVLTPAFLNTLVSKKAACILYTHLGKISNRDELLPHKSRQAFALLASYFTEGKILVTTTRRLLGYCRMLEEVSFNVKTVGNVKVVDIQYSGPIQDLDGLCFQMANSTRLNVSHNGCALSPVQYHDLANENMSLVSIPWNRLNFPLK